VQKSLRTTSLDRDAKSGHAPFISIPFSEISGFLPVMFYQQALVCWATAQQAPESYPRYYIIDNGSV